MISVLIASESRYPVSRPKIKETVTEYLKNLGIDDVEISVIIVGERKIRELNREWRKLDEETAVLTFGLEEPRDASGTLRIGDIVISYPEARTIAEEDNLLVNEAIDKLLIHGLKNLLGSIPNDNNFLSKVSPAKISGFG